MAYDPLDNQTQSGNKLFTSKKVLVAKSALNEASGEVDARHARAVTLFVESSAGVNGAIVRLESAPYAGFTGTWKNLGEVTLSAPTIAEAITAVEGDDGLPARVVRARITVAVTGGTIDAYIETQG